MVRSQIKKESYKWQAAKGLELYFGGPANEVIFLFSFSFYCGKFHTETKFSIYLGSGS